MNNKPIINSKKCSLCKMCVEVCPRKILYIKDKKIDIINNECILCSHCYSVCKFDAISFDENILRKPKFKSIKYSEKIINQNKINKSDFINAIRSRRSIRKYSSKPLPDNVISDLVEFAITAPSGSNYQNWEFIVINDREKVWNLALEFKKFFIKLNKIAINPITRYLSILFVGFAVIRYYKNNSESVKKAIKESENKNDMLFYNAPTLFIIHSTMDATSPIEDAQYASYNITLLANTMGIGTCYIGYAVNAINRSRNIKKYLGIPQKNRVHAVLTAGYANITYHKLALRKNYNIKWM